MKLAELDTATVYAIGAAGAISDPDPGVVLDTVPWIRNASTGVRGRPSPVYSASPDGRYGRKVWGKIDHYGDTRGLLTVTTSGHALVVDYIGDPDDPDDPSRTVAQSVADRDARVAALPEIGAAALAALHADPDTDPALPPGYTLRMMRPQDIPSTWAEHLDRKRVSAENDQELRVRRAAEAQRQRAARDRMIAVIEPPESELTGYGRWGGTEPARYMTWVELEALCERYAERKAGPLPELAACAVRPPHGPHVYHAAAVTGADLGERTCPGVQR